MKIFVVNVFYNEDLEAQTQISRVFKINEQGEQEEIQTEEVLFEKSGTVVLACRDESNIMQTLRALISDKITDFELVSVTDLEESQMQGMMEGEPEELGKIILQIGI